MSGGMRLWLGLGIGAALCVGGCSLLFNGSDLHGTDGGNQDMSAGGSGGSDGGNSTGDMTGGGGAGGGGGGGGIPSGPLTLAFTKSTPVSVGMGPIDVVAGDFDNDGHLDVATANYGDTNITFVFGDGTKLGNAMSVTVPPPDSTHACSPYAVAAGRFDADAIVDLVVTCTDQDKSNTVVLFPGSATRSFSGMKIAALTSITTAASFEGIAAGDFNHDGKLDVAVSEYQNSMVWIVVGNGNGGFSASTQQIAAGANPVGLAAGDLDGDTRDDLVVFDYGVPHAFQVLLQAPTTGLQGAVAYQTSGSTGAGALADVNHDGHLDILAADQSDDKALVSLNMAAMPGTFTNNPMGPMTHPTPEHIAAADFDHDGHLDLVTTDEITNQIDILLGVGDGTFATPVPVTGLTSADGLVVGDFTGDGLPDIVVTNDGATPTITLIVNTSH